MDTSESEMRAMVVEAIKQRSAPLLQWVVVVKATPPIKCTHSDAIIRPGAPGYGVIECPTCFGGTSLAGGPYSFLKEPRIATKWETNGIAPMRPSGLPMWMIFEARARAILSFGLSAAEVTGG
jgi:hypothetical protein